MDTLILPTSIATFLKPVASRIVLTGYVHATRPGQTTYMEYCNMTPHPQRIVTALLHQDGSWVSGLIPRTSTLQPSDFFRVDAGEWAQAMGHPSFQGQLLLSIEEDMKPSPKRVTAAVTSHWRSESSYCHVAYQGFGRINVPNQSSRSTFFMFCPAVIMTGNQTTVFVLFNISTDPAYTDTVELQPTLSSMDGWELVGKPVRIPPFGMMWLDVSDHFGSQGKDLLASSQGHGSLTIAHIGHAFPSFFFHLERSSNNIIDGQHSQPPSSVISLTGVWWGRLRQLIV